VRKKKIQNHVAETFKKRALSDGQGTVILSTMIYRAIALFVAVQVHIISLYTIKIHPLNPRADYDPYASLFVDLSGKVGLAVRAYNIYRPVIGIYRYCRPVTQRPNRLVNMSEGRRFDIASSIDLPTYY